MTISLAQLAFALYDLKRHAPSDASTWIIPVPTEKGFENLVFVRTEHSAVVRFNDGWTLAETITVTPF